MTDAAEKLLQLMLAAGGTYPDVAVTQPVGRELMQLGLIEAIKPAAPFLPYLLLTTSGENHARNTAQNHRRDAPRVLHGR